MSTNQRRLTNYGVAFALVAAATFINLLAWQTGSNQDGHYFGLVVAILISALYGGLGPGLVATALAGLSSSYFTLLPQFSITITSPIATRRLVIFLVEGVLLSLFAHFIRNGKVLASSRHNVLDYAIIPAAVVGATIPKVLLSHLASELPFALNYAAVCACAWSRGFLAGVVATSILAAITKYLFLEPIYSLSVGSQTEAIRVGLFVGECLLLSLLGNAYARLKSVAETFAVRIRAYIAAAVGKEQDAAAMRAISRDTIWEWGIDTGEIIRTPSYQDAISSALPNREQFTSWAARIHPEDRDATIMRLQRAIEEGREELQYSYRLLSPDGNFLSVWDHAFIVRGADWRPLRVIGRSAEMRRELWL